MDLVDRCYLIIDGDEVVCESIDTEVDPSAEIVEAMTRDNLALGLAHGNQKISISAVTAMDSSSDGIDFEQMCLNKTQFSAVKEYEGGLVKTYVECSLMKVSERARTGSHVSYNLDIYCRGVAG